MANKALFDTLRTGLKRATHRNEAGAPAYALTPRHALAQYAATGCLNTTFYADAGDQLRKVLELCRELDAPFLARTAVYARERGAMKDVPALLCAVLAARDVKLLERVFPRVVDDAKMLRNFVQILRSGVTGRCSLGSAPRRLVREWLAGRDDDALFRSSVGRSPSLGDVVRLAHPRPATATREALYGYLAGRFGRNEVLPALVRDYEAFRRGDSLAVPEVPVEMLTALPLSVQDWRQVARRASWQATRMYLNSFARRGVFGDAGTTRAVAERLRDRRLMARARALPYQLMVAWANADAEVPGEVREALQDAMEQALDAMPRLPARTWVLPDVSGSMQAPVTGYRKGSSSAVRCLDVAALIAAAVLRRNREAHVLPFNHRVVDLTLDPRDGVMSNAARLAALPAGGTDCSAPLREMNREGARGELVIFVSDNQSWLDAGHAGQATAVMKQWKRFKARNPEARLVCIDIQPYANTQAHDREDVLNVGGFSDQVFELVAAFTAGRMRDGHWVSEIEAIDI